MVNYAELTSGNFTEFVQNDKEAILVYFTTLAADKQVKDEYKYFNRMSRFLFGAVKVAVFRVNKEAEDFKDIKKRFKLSKLDDNTPELRFFKNDLTGDDKQGSMVNIAFDKENKNLRDIYDDISAAYTSEIQDINP